MLCSSGWLLISGRSFLPGRRYGNTDWTGGRAKCLWGLGREFGVLVKIPTSGKCGQKWGTRPQKSTAENGGVIPCSCAQRWMGAGLSLLRMSRPGEASGEKALEAGTVPIFYVYGLDSAALEEELREEEARVGVRRTDPEMAAEVFIQGLRLRCGWVFEKSKHGVEETVQLFWIVGIALGDPPGHAFLSEINLIALAIEAAQSEPSQQVCVFHRDADEDALAL